MSGIFCDISDHYPIFHITKTSTENCDPNINKKRQFNDINISQFRRNLSTHDWSELYLINVHQIAFSQFYNTFKIKFDECFPVNNFKSSCYTKQTWLTPALCESFRTKTTFIKNIKGFLSCLMNAYITNIEISYVSYNAMLKDVIISMSSLNTNIT